MDIGINLFGYDSETKISVDRQIELMKKYGDIEKVRRALNHNSESVTMIYALADQQLQAKYRRRRAASGRKAS